MTDSADWFQGETGVSRETLDRLSAYADLLRQWSPRINLVAPATLKTLWSRHMLDSAQLLDLAPTTAQRWTDLGSGGGFPGLVIAILAHTERPDLKVTLIEADQRKATFLRTAAQRFDIDVTVLAKRIEDAPPTEADIVSARALAPLDRLLDLCLRHVAPTGALLLPKGRQHREERAKALETWTFHCENLPSRTDKEAVILRISEVRRGRD